MNRKALFPLLLLMLLAPSLARAEARPAAQPGGRRLLPMLKNETKDAKNLLPGRAPAAKTPTAPPINSRAVLSKAYQERAMKLLERYIPVKEFQISADVTPSDKALPRTPYDPNALTANAFENMAIEELETFVTRVQLEILIGTRLSSMKSKIDELLVKSLKLKRGRDRIRFDSLGIEVEPEAWQKQKLEMKQEMAMLEKQKEELMSELTAAKAKAEQVGPSFV